MARKRKRYSNEQRTTILATAVREGLTANDVRKRFGVTPVTYYSWRKKTGAGRRRGRPAAVVMASGASNGDLASTVRSAVAQRMRAMLPDIVRGEVNSFLDSLLGQASGGRGRPAVRRRRRRRRVRIAKAKA